VHYFVSPTPPQENQTPVYRIFIEQQPWDTLWNNIKDGMCAQSDCCDYNDTKWDGQERVTVVKDGIVYPAIARYTGSPGQRYKGYEIES
jgi:hypothetical protein